MVKVLHIVESFEGQAIEKWLALLVAESEERGHVLNWSFYCTQKSSGPYAETIERLGCKVICSPYPISMPLKFLIALRTVIRNGRYDIVHSHHDIMSGFYFLACLGFRNCRRVMHIHNASLALPTPSRVKRIAASICFKFLSVHLADRIVGVSEVALNSLLQGEKNRKCSVIHCAVALHPISDDCRSVLRCEFGIPQSALVLLFVGRMIAYKNPVFVIKIFQALLQRNVDVYCIFVGKGHLQRQIEELAESRGVGTRVRCLGWRSDVAEIMATSDALIFPSIEKPMEGLGLSVVEAQSIGLPVVMSMGVPEEAIVIQELVERLPLRAGTIVWASKIIQLTTERSLVSREKHQDVVRQSSFSPQQSLSSLIALYMQEV